MKLWISGLFFQVLNREIRHVSVECPFCEHFSNQVLPKGPSSKTPNKTPTLICRCLQALAEALKTHASVTEISLGDNQIGDEGAKAWCVMGSAESLNAAACHYVMFSKSSDSEKFGRVGGAVV